MDKIKNGISALSAVPVYAEQFNELVEEVTTNAASAATTQAAVDVLEAFNTSTTSSNIYITSKTLTATTIVGTDAGDLGHASGAELVAAPGAGKCLEFLSAVLLFDGMGVAYTGGGDDTVVQLGTTVVSGAITKASLLGATGDKMVQIMPLSTGGIVLANNTALNLKSTTAWTQPGTAAGTLLVNVMYKIHNNGF